MSDEGTTENPRHYEEAPERDPNPRGPDAPEPEKAHEQRLVIERHEEASEIPPGKKRALPAVRWIGTNGYNYDPARGGYAINGIVIHTEVGTNASATGRFKTPGQASAHYGVAYDGSYVDQWVREQDTAWHCGRYLPDAGHMGNRNSIGIEHEDNGAYNSPRPDGLYEASAQLVADICRRYGLPATHNTIRGEAGHREISVVGTACPDSLDVDRIIARAATILQPPAPPAWKGSLHAEDFSVQLDKAVPMYDVTNGQARPTTVGPGQFVSAYRGTVDGVDYRMTKYSFDHDAPYAVRTADVEPVPVWKTALHAEAYSATLPVAVDLYDLMKGKPAGVKVPAGAFASAYRGTINGVDYRVTAFSFDHSTARGVRTADVAPAPPPIVVPEWKKNLVPESHSWTLAKAVSLRNMDNPPDVKGSIGPGPLQVQYATSVKGVGYWMTQYSVDHGVGNGLNQAEVAAAIQQPPTPGPTPSAPNFWQAIIDFVRSLFGAK